MVLERMRSRLEKHVFRAIAAISGVAFALVLLSVGSLVLFYSNSSVIYSNSLFSSRDVLDASSQSSNARGIGSIDLLRLFQTPPERITHEVMMPKPILRSLGSGEIMENDIIDDNDIYIDTIDVTVDAGERLGSNPGNLATMELPSLDLEVETIQNVNLFEDIFALDLKQEQQLHQNDNDFESQGALIQCTRTSNQPYNQIDFQLKDSSKKYFLYSPSGGLSNQRSEMEYAIMLAKILNRIVIFPMIGKHTTWWTKYSALDMHDLLPSDYIFDFEHLQKKLQNEPEYADVKFIVTNMTITELESKLFTIAKTKSSEQRKVFKLLNPKRKVAAEWKEDADIIANVGVYEDKFLFLKGPGMYHRWYNDTTKYTVSRHLVYNPCLRRYAVEIAKQVLRRQLIGPNVVDSSEEMNFKAMHIRLGDYYKWGRAPSVPQLMRAMQEKGFRNSDAIYIATEPKRPRSFFDPLEKEFPSIFYSENFGFIRRDLMKQKFIVAFATNRELVDDLIGIIEQLVCILAERFLGTSYSNFSKYIQVLIENSAETFPELELVRQEFKTRMNSQALIAKDESVTAQARVLAASEDKKSI